MRPVGFGESTRYGLWLYAYVLAVLVLGGAGVVLGAVLLWPEVQASRGPGRASVTIGVAGGVLLFLGLSVLVVGWLATAYKLVADGAATGRGRSAGARAPANQAESTTDQAEQSQPEREPAEPDGPQEMSASEIAFGSDGEPTAPVDDGPLPGDDAADDPLGDRSR